MREGSCLASMEDKVRLGMMKFISCCRCDIGFHVTPESACFSIHYVSVWKTDRLSTEEYGRRSRVLRAVGWSFREQGQRLRSLHGGLGCEAEGYRCLPKGASEVPKVLESTTPFHSSVSLFAEHWLVVPPANQSSRQSTPHGYD